VRLMYILNPDFKAHNCHTIEKSNVLTVRQKNHDFKALNCHAIGKSRVLTMRLMYFLNNDFKAAICHTIVKNMVGTGGSFPGCRGTNQFCNCEAQT